MAKKFFDVFPGLKLERELKELMGQTEVERISATKRKDFLRIYLNSAHLIQKESILQTEEQMKKQLFPGMAITVKIYEKFQLSSQYSPEKLMDIYRNSILEELKQYSHIEYNMFKNAKISYPSDDRMLLQMEDSVPAKSRKQS